jgi:GDP-4-dehydro-6-deoxy-D-mannose reductase
VADRLCALAGADVELVTDPSLVRAVDLPVLRGNCERLTRATRWHPDIPFDQTLGDVLAYWRETVT